MIYAGGETVTRYLTPTDEWGVLLGIEYLLDRGELDTKAPNSKQQGYMLSTNCVICNDGTIKLFAKEVQHLNNKLPFPCLHARVVNLFRLNPARVGTVFPTPRPGFPVLPDIENKANKTANAIRAGASSVVSAVETGKLQERSDDLKEGMRQLMAVNKRLRGAMDGCEDGMIKVYPNLEIPNIDEFMGDLVESTETLDVDTAFEILGRIVKVKEEDATSQQNAGGSQQKTIPRDLQRGRDQVD